jgi:SHS2 domain-containing protein
MEPLEPRRTRTSSRQQPATGVDHRVPAAQDTIDLLITTRSDKGLATDDDGDETRTTRSTNDGSVVGNYEYLDHTADIQLHSWGDTFAEALADIVLAMFGYMTDLRKVEATNPCHFSYNHATTSELDEDSETTTAVRVIGHDKESLVFNTMQELLTRFHEDHFVVRTLTVDEGVENEMHFAELEAFGESFDDDRHITGTEVKAVTYSDLKVAKDDNGRWDIWVIVDI